MVGNMIHRGGNEKLRSSDHVERVYCGVEGLRRAEIRMKEACFDVADYFGPKGDGETIRRLYNDFKQRHAWRDKLPTSDLVYDLWYRRFADFRECLWAAFMEPIERGAVGWALGHYYREGGGSKTPVYGIVSGLRRDGILAMLESRASLSHVQLPITTEQFIADFLRAVSL